MNSIVLELQRDALNPSISVLILLRKAYVVARKLNIRQFQEWIELELNGYKGHPIPEYRAVKGQLRAWNPYHGWHQIVTHDQNLLEIYETVCNYSIGQSISELSALTNNADNELQMQLPPRVESFLAYSVSTSVKVGISSASVKRIVESVRDVILEWVLKLEEDGITGEGMVFSQEEKQTAAKQDYSGFIQIINNIEQSQMQNSSSESQSSSESFKNDLRGANVGNFANQVSGNARQQANQHIHLSESKKTLAEAAEEIQQLLKQLEQTNPTATELQKVAYVNDETTPSFKRRVAGALQASGETAIDEFILENKYLKVVKAAIKGWLQPGS
ncbi:AbiTii domain-containing protein [Nostoc sp.]|uniref:AbiTii domain-containing protein n=1 Tax=Nostoc sp. TaxID=1180 RepID=UPI002FFA623E